MNKLSYKTRNVSLDLLRIFSCLCIIVLHESAHLPLSSNDWYAYQAIVRPCLWVFVFISGYFVLSKPITDIKIFYLKKATAIIIPLVIYSIIYQIYYGFSNIDSPLALLRSISFKNILANQVSGHLWFVYSIIGAYLAAPFLQKLLYNLDKRMLLMFLTLFYFFTGIIAYFELLGFKIAVSTMFSGVFFFYFILGYVANKFNMLEYKNTILLLGAFNFGIMFYVARFPNIQQTLYTSSVNMVIGVLFYYILFRQFEILQSFCGQKIIAYLSNKTYSIYLIHILVLTILNESKVFPYTESNHLIHPFALSVLIFLISIVCTIIIDFLITAPLIKICLGFFKLSK